MSGNNVPEQPLTIPALIELPVQPILNSSALLPAITFDHLDESGNLVKPHELPEYVCASIERYEQTVHRMRVLGYIQVQESTVQKRAASFAVLKQAIEVLGARNPSRAFKELMTKILHAYPSLTTVKSAGKHLLDNNFGESLLLYAALARNIWAMDTLLMMGADQEAPSPVIMRGMGYGFFRRVIQEHGVTPQILARLMINLNQKQIEDLREWLPNAIIGNIQVTRETQLFGDAIAIVDDMKTKRAAMLAFCSGLKKNDEGKLIKPTTALGRFLASDGDGSVSRRVLSMFFEPYSLVERPTPTPPPRPLLPSFDIMLRDTPHEIFRAFYLDVNHAAGEPRTRAVRLRQVP